MRKIYKYTIETTDVQTIKVPKLAGVNSFTEQFLKVDVQKEKPCIWCLVDTMEEEQEITLHVVGTGNPMPLLSKDNYLGSYMLYNGELVFHLFYEQ